MKKYFLMIPLMLFPYAYLIWLIYMYFSSDVMDKIFGYQTAAYIWLCIAALYLIYIIFIVFYNTIVSARGTYSAYQAAQINLFVKGVQVPAYIFHFVLGNDRFFHFFILERSGRRHTTTLYSQPIAAA